MQMLIYIVLLTFCFHALPSTSYGQDYYRLNRNENGHRANRAREYQKADTEFTGAIMEAEKIGARDSTLADSYGGLALSQFERGGYKEARESYYKALELLANSSRGPDSILLATTLSNLGVLNERVEEYSDALRDYESAGEIISREYGADSVQFGTVLSNIGCVKIYLRDFSGAEDCLKKSLKIKVDRLGGEDISVAITRSNLANAYLKQGRYVESLAEHEASISIMKSKLTENDIRIGISLNSYAALLSAQARFNDAEPMFRESLRIHLRRLPDDHIDVASGLHSLGLNCRMQGKYAEAEELFRKSLDIREKRLSRNHPDILNSIMNLSRVCRCQSKYDLALRYQQRVVDWFEKMAPLDVRRLAGARRSLAILLHLLGDTTRATQLDIQSLNDLQQQATSDEAETAALLVEQGDTSFREESYATAEQQFWLALEFNEICYGPDDSRVGKVWGELAAAVRRQGRTEEAELYAKIATRISSSFQARD